MTQKTGGIRNRSIQGSNISRRTEGVQTAEFLVGELAQILPGILRDVNYSADITIKVRPSEHELLNPFATVRHVDYVIDTVETGKIDPEAAHGNYRIDTNRRR